ncbi:TPA: hypothetical protein ACGO1A_001816 [Streptococcus suis]
MLKPLKTWWNYVEKKGKLKYLCEIIPSLMLTFLSFVVVNEDIVKCINENFKVFVLIIFLLLVINYIFEVSRAVEIDDIRTKCDEEIHEISNEVVNKEDKILKLEDAVEHLKQAFKSLPTDFLHDFSDKLGLGNHDRITFYLYNDKRFVNIGRHSNNSSFGKTQFGNTFEESDNYISKCFHNEQDDFFIRVGLPNPDINFEKYSQMMCKDFSKFDKEELKKVTMKSRCYFGKKIYGSDRNPIGVLMIESRKSNLSVILGGKKKELKKKTEYEELSNLIDLNFQYILQSLHKYTNHYY